MFKYHRISIKRKTTMYKRKKSGVEPTFSACPKSALTEQTWQRRYPGMYHSRDFHGALIYLDERSLFKLKDGRDEVLYKVCIPLGSCSIASSTAICTRFSASNGTEPTVGSETDSTNVHG